MLPRLDRSYPKCVKNLEKHAKNEPTYKTSKRNSRPRGRIITKSRDGVKSIASA